MTLRSHADRAQQLLIDYVVHHARASGEARSKVFKGWTLALEPGEVRQLQKMHSMRVVTTRRYHAGRHAIDVQINGQVVAHAGFALTLE